MGTVDALLYFYVLLSYIFVTSENSIVDENSRNIQRKNSNFDTISDVKCVFLGDYKPLDDVDYGYQSSRHKRDKRLSFTKSTMPPPPRAMTDNEPDWMEDEMDNPSSEKSSEAQVSPLIVVDHRWSLSELKNAKAKHLAVTSQPSSRLFGCKSNSECSEESTLTSYVSKMSPPISRPKEDWTLPAMTIGMTDNNVFSKFMPIVAVMSTSKSPDCDRTAADKQSSPPNPGRLVFDGRNLPHLHATTGRPRHVSNNRRQKDDVFSKFLTVPTRSTNPFKLKFDENGIVHKNFSNNIQGKYILKKKTDTTVEKGI